ncbi:hypothetical protein IMG5_154330 [Ichthyophthirius multifiliis]|uniref:Uncharacterized protein n=1 Tax=Ichthyophthirius multifiliis TaxID=5932 RepID=G0QZ45_ICHMU|nr:hypothetical protein IMG5_154330 [Ichthyophthirius multifiliis]EGR29512.1 hypothetical protein IMG5_154330 [Ichthyophthirius multifiliis]|eukprot:XP_004030748.1 hypothetical protein IMG5_154330 [Ichthyophthirius multifiliis]
MTMYINKKVSNTRQKEGKKLTAQQLRNGIDLQIKDNQNYNFNLIANQLEQKKKQISMKELYKEHQSQQNDPIYKQMEEKLFLSNYNEDFIIFSTQNEDQHKQKNKKERSDQQKNLSFILSQNILPQKIEELYKDFKKVQLKNKLNELKRQNEDMEIIQRNIKNQNKLQEYNKEQQKNKRILSRICKKSQFNISTILNIDNNDIQYKKMGIKLQLIKNLKLWNYLMSLFKQKTKNKRKIQQKFINRLKLIILDKSFQKVSSKCMIQNKKRINLINRNTNLRK